MFYEDSFQSALVIMLKKDKKRKGNATIFSTPGTCTLPSNEPVVPSM